MILLSMLSLRLRVTVRILEHNNIIHFNYDLIRFKRFQFALLFKKISQNVSKLVRPFARIHSPLMFC